MRALASRVDRAGDVLATPETLGKIVSSLSHADPAVVVAGCGVARALPFRWSPSAVRGYATRRWRALEFLDGDADAFDALVEYAAGVIMMRGVSERSMSLLLKPLGQARTEIGPVVERTPADLPVTFLYGAHDWMSPASGAEVVERMRANGRANVRCAILDDAGHYAFVDQPEKSHEVIEHALRKARWR